MIQLTLPPTNRKAKSKATPHLACPGVPWERSTSGASWENGTNNQRWVPHCPDFLWRLVALIHSMRLSLMKGAHADFSCAAWQGIGSSPVFACPGVPWGLEWDTQQSPPSHPARQGVPWEQLKEITQQNSPRMRGPEGRPAKLQPSPEGLGIHPEDDMSAGGAALNPATTCVIPRPQP
jgi:hypothetical protein